MSGSKQFVHFREVVLFVECSLSEVLVTYSLDFKKDSMAFVQDKSMCIHVYIRASVDAPYSANVHGDAHMQKASMLHECVNMSLLRHLVKLYKAY